MGREGGGGGKINIYLYFFKVAVLQWAEIGDDLGQKCPIQPQQFTIHFGQWDMNYSGL